MIDPKALNKQQTELRRMLLETEQHSAAIALFFRQHAALHSAAMAHSDIGWYEDELFRGLPEAQARCIPLNGEHSIAWLLWHIARIEDVTMNMLVAGVPQRLHKDGWYEKLGVTAQDTGNEMSETGVDEVSTTINIVALRAYRAAVGRQTREIVSSLSAESLKEKVDADRLQRVLDEGAVVSAAQGIINYWGKRNIAGLLLMPATRHNLVHLNEAMRVKQKCQ